MNIFQRVGLVLMFWIVVISILSYPFEKFEQYAFVVFWGIVSTFLVVYVEKEA